MKLAYRFPAIGHLRLESRVPLEHMGCVFHFELDENQAVTHLSVTIPVAPTDIPTALHGFIKKTRATPAADLKLARMRKKEIER